MKHVLSNKKAIALFVIPAFIIYTIIVILPVFWSLGYSLYSGSPGFNWNFVGINNYLKLFDDKNFRAALIVNLKYIAIVMVGQVGLGLCLSLIFNFWLKRGKNLIRTLLFFPVVLPTVAVGQLFAKIFEIQPNYGLLNSLLDNIGLSEYVQPWIGQASTALLSLSGMDIWVAMGFYAVIFYGSLLDIPGDEIEAARIDGCNAWNLFLRIIVPHIRPIIITCLVFSFSGTVKMFESALALTKGGPGNSTTSLSMYMYNASFSYGKVGYGSTIAVFIFALCIFGTWIINRFDRKESEGV